MPESVTTLQRTGGREISRIVYDEQTIASRVAEMGQMHADLVRPAGLQPAGEEACDRLSVDPRIFFQKFPMGHRLAAVRADRLLVAGVGVAPERGVD